MLESCSTSHLQRDEEEEGKKEKKCGKVARKTCDRKTCDRKEKTKVNIMC